MPINFNMEKVVNRLGNQDSLRFLRRRMLKGLETVAIDGFFDLFLEFMRWKFLLDPEFRKNIKGFSAKYQFRTKDGDAIAKIVRFKDGTMDVLDGVDDNPTVTVYFKDGKALLNFLFSPAREMLQNLLSRGRGLDAPVTFDILEGLLRNEVSVVGNLNYLYKFGFLANHLLLEVTGQLPP